MEDIPIGSRVFTEVLDGNDLPIGTYGEGTYIGDYSYPGTSTVRFSSGLAPKIALDQGGYAYGAEDCYWYVIPGGWQAPDLELMSAPWSS